MNASMNTVACIALVASLTSPVRAGDFLTELSRTDGNVAGEHNLAAPSASGEPSTQLVAFMHEMARSDGDVGGEHARPEIAREYGQPTRQQMAFLQELARSDGNVTAQPIEIPSGIAIARR